MYCLFGSVLLIKYLLAGDSGICAAGWNAQFGITGEASTAADLVILFRLNNAQVELNGYINTISNGKGIKQI
jgi:hypothetical protein